MSGKISSGADLEARIAELDDRLRQARADNDALKRRMSPSPPAPGREGSVPRNVFDSPPPVLSLRGGSASRRVDPTPPNVPHSPYLTSPLPVAPRLPQANTPSAGQPAAIPSPWSDVARTAAKTSDEETSKIHQLQRISTSALETRIQDKHGSLTSTYRATHQSEADLSAQRRQKEIAVADGQRALDEAQRRWSIAERQQQELTAKITTANEQRTSALRHVEELRAAISRAELRQVDLVKDEAELRTRLHEASVSSREKSVGSHAEEQFAATLRARMEQRVSELEDENAAAAERYRRLEQQFAAQQAVWAQNEYALQSEAEAATTLQHSVQTRLTVLDGELLQQDAEAERLRRQRQERAEQLAVQRASDCEQELSRIRRESAVREEQLRREQEEAIHILRNEQEETQAQVDKKRRTRDEQQQVVDGLRVQLAQLQADAEKRAARQAECEALDGEVQQLQAQLAATMGDIDAVKTDIVSREEELARLRAVSRTLTAKVGDEKRLRDVVAELALEVHEAQTQHEAEMAVLERHEAEQLSLVDDARRQLVRANDDLDRIAADASVELGVLSRTIAALRQNAADKEGSLNAVIAENAAKQATIAQFEEEKRRLERDQIARKAAAAQATKAALAELNSY